MKTTDCDFTSWENDGLMKTSQTVENYVQEKYVDVTDATVLELHKSRIDLAHQIGCDGVDPDNIDTFVRASESLLLDEADWWNRSCRRMSPSASRSHKKT